MLQTLEVLGVTFDVYYDLERKYDMMYTGFGPSERIITFVSIEIGTDTQNVKDILPSTVIDEITDALIKIDQQEYVEKINQLAANCMTGKVVKWKELSDQRAWDDGMYQMAIDQKRFEELSRGVI